MMLSQGATSLLYRQGGGGTAHETGSTHAMKQDTENIKAPGDTMI